jgi:hypothetical protein
MCSVSIFAANVQGMTGSFAPGAGAIKDCADM